MDIWYFMEIDEEGSDISKAKYWTRSHPKILVTLVEEGSNSNAYSDTKDSMWIKYVSMILKVCWMLQTAHQQASHMTNQRWL